MAVRDASACVRDLREMMGKVVDLHRGETAAGLQRGMYYLRVRTVHTELLAAAKREGVPLSEDLRTLEGFYASYSLSIDGKVNRACLEGVVRFALHHDLFIWKDGPEFHPALLNTAVYRLDAIRKILERHRPTITREAVLTVLEHVKLLPSKQEFTRWLAEFVGTEEPVSVDGNHETVELLNWRSSVTTMDTFELRQWCLRAGLAVPERLENGKVYGVQLVVEELAPLGGHTKEVKVG